MDWRNQIQGNVTYYRYRTATVTDIICVLPRDLCQELEKHLAGKVGFKPDNHVVYMLEQPWWSKDPVYIRFSDHNVMFAKTLVVQSDEH